MPKKTSIAVKAAKLAGGKYVHLIELALPSPLYLSDSIDIFYDEKTFLGNGVLLEVDAGAMTEGVKSNDWNVILSSSDPIVTQGVIGQHYLNSWVFHHKAWINDDGEIIGVETKKFGQVLTMTEEDDTKTSEIEITVSSPFGDAKASSGIKTNLRSHQKHYGVDDVFFKYAHETSTSIKGNINVNIYGPSANRKGNSHIQEY
jgi:hypothetical protein